MWDGTDGEVGNGRREGGDKRGWVDLVVKRPGR